MMVSWTRQVANAIMLIMLVLVVHSCKPEVEFDNLKLDENCLYYNSNDSKKKPFSGVAYATFKNSIREDSNTISSTANFRDGVPNGKFVDYASKEEVFQSGEFVPVFDVARLQKYFVYIKRLNICKTYFNSTESEILVTVVSSQPAIDSIDMDAKEEVVKDFLRTHKYVTDNELKLIYKVEVLKGEY